MLTTRIIRLTGQITAANAGEVKQNLIDALQQGPCMLALDLSSVTYIDSSGLGVLTFASGKARELGSKLRLHQLQARVYDVLVATRMIGLFDVEDSPPGSENWED